MTPPISPCTQFVDLLDLVLQAETLAWTWAGKPEAMRPDGNWTIPLGEPPFKATELGFPRIMDDELDLPMTKVTATLTLTLTRVP